MRINRTKQHAAPQAYEKRCVKAVLPAQQDAEHQRGKSIWRNQSGRFWFQEAIAAAVANDQQQFDNSQLHENNAENEKNSRVLLEAFWLIDPKLRDRSGQNQERNDVILRWLRLLTAKDEKRQTTSKQRKNKYLCIRRAFQVAHQFTVQPAPSPLARCEAASNETAAFEEIEHNNGYLRDSGSGARCAWYAPMMARTSSCRTTSRSVKYTVEIPGTLFKACKASRTPERLFAGKSICVTSPVTTHLEFKPMRVSNMNICSVVVFWASSRITKALLKVRPRIYASGATSIVCRAIARSSSSASNLSRNASWSGRRYGRIFCSKSPGRKPSASPASTAGRVKIMRATCSFFSAATAIATAR